MNRRPSQGNRLNSLTRRIAAAPDRTPGILILGFLVAYVALDWLSYLYPVAPLAITPWNPPPGLSLAFLLRYGLRNAPWLFVATFAAEVLVRGAALPLPLLVLSSALLAGGYAATSWILAGPLRLDPDFRTLRDATVFLATAAVGTFVIAATFVGLFALAGVLPADAWSRSFAGFWIGDLIGIAVMTPLLLVYTRPGRVAQGQRTAETLLQATAIAAAVWLVFGSGLLDELKLFYILFLPLIWIAMRRGLEGATVAMLAIQLGLIAAMYLGGYQTHAVVEFQFLLLTLAVTGTLLGIAVSQRRDMEAELREKQFELDRSLRLAAVSEMASALAHELNQPLSAVANYVRACQLIAADAAAPRELLAQTMDKAIVEVGRAGDVMRGLREFFRSGSTRLDHVDPVSLIARVLENARPRAVRHQIRCEYRGADSLPAVLVDTLQIETVLHNLVANAIDALKQVDPAQRRLTIDAAVDGRAHVRVTVTDTGPGIASDVRGTLFRPFATSKVQGMGMGLSIARSLVEAHGGSLRLESSVSGCKFSFTLPIVDRA